MVPRPFDPTVYVPAIVEPRATPPARLLSSSPAVIVPLPSAVIAPAIATDPVEGFVLSNPRNRNEYEPLKSERLLLALAFTLMLRACVVVVDVESSSCSVKVDVPVRIGVPEITPATGSSVRPEGSCPFVMLHVNGGTPPLT